MASKQDVLDVAVRAVEQRRSGDTSWRCTRVRSRSIDEPHVVTFDLNEGGYCARFVRQCHDAALGQGEWAWGFAAPTAREMERKLRAAGLITYTPQPGDIICMNNQDAAVGHIGIYLGMVDGLETIAENTSSTSRGNPRAAGTKISPLSAVAKNVSGYYAALPSESKPGYAPGNITVEYDGKSVPGNFTDHSIVGVANVARLLGYEVEDHVPGERRVVLVKQSVFPAVAPDKQVAS